jgi:hypothetical protein
MEAIEVKNKSITRMTANPGDKKAVIITSIAHTINILLQSVMR